MTRKKPQTEGNFRTHVCGKAILFSIAISMLYAAGCEPASKISPQPPLVEVATVTSGAPPIYREWIGTLDGLVNAQIRAQVTGYLPWHWGFKETFDLVPRVKGSAGELNA
jgi:hypothetical protein